MTTHKEALKHIKTITEAFGPDEGIELDQKAWSKLHAAIKEALAQPEQEPDYKAIGQQAYESGYSTGYMDCAVKMKAQPEQEPVAMKFKIYKPTVPDPMRQGINNALLPWVYDQDRSSGFDASMWVTPVATLPPQPYAIARKPLTDEQIGSCIDEVNLTSQYGHHHFGWHKQFAKAIEAAHGIKE